jgi:hypothetical protein
MLHRGLPNARVVHLETALLINHNILGRDSAVGETATMHLLENGEDGLNCVNELVLGECQFLLFLNMDFNL